MSLNVDDIAYQLLDKVDSVSYGKLIHFPFQQNPFKRLFEGVLSNPDFGEEFHLIFLCGPTIGLELWKLGNQVPEFKRLEHLPEDSCIGHAFKSEVHVSLSKWLVENKIYAVGIYQNNVTRSMGITIDLSA